MIAVARTPVRIALGLALLLGLLVAQAWSAAPARAVAAPEYDSVPATLPPSWLSLGYEATQTAEFGDLVELGGTNRDLASITVGLVDWACETGGGATCLTTPGATWTHPITVNVYAEGTPPTPGTLLGTVTQTVTVPYRPSADPTNCGVGATTWYNPTTATCHNGFAFTATFDFSALVLSVPDRILVTVAYNTEHYGATPMAATGPYNSLNVALATTSPTVGSDVDADSMYWNTSTAGWYADGGVGGVGTLRADDGGWAGYGLVLEVATDDLLSTLPAPGGGTPAGGGSAGGSLQTLADSGSEPNVPAMIAALALVMLGIVLRVVAPRRAGAHRA
jgi:hypothetical protein